MEMKPSAGPVARLLDNRAQDLFDQGRFEEAIEAAETGVESARRLYEEGNLDTLRDLLDTMIVTADIKRHTGFMEAAETLYRDVLKLSSPEEGMQRQIAFAEAGLGDICEDRDAVTDALRHYETAIKGLDEIGVDVTEECCRLRNNLAMIYKDEGDHEASESHLITGIQRMESVFGRYNPTTATLYSNLAALYCSVSHYDEAREVGLLARDIRRQILPANHIENAQSLSNLGAIHYALDDYDAAVDCFALALDAMDSNVETNPEDYEVVVSNYIDLLRQLGKEDKAQEIAKEARSRYKELNQMRHQFGAE